MNFFALKTRGLGLAASFLIMIAGMLAAVPAAAETVKVVAAENFYGDIVGQIGGDRVSVASIMSDPNVDPHEYESNVNDAKVIADASLVIESSGGYDDWMDKLLGASPNPDRIVLKGYDIATTKIPENEHVWYDPDNAIVIAGAVQKALAKLDPADAPAFEKNLGTFKASVEKLIGQMRRIRAKYNGTPIALTETIFQYQARLLGLDILTPQEFQKAVAEGQRSPGGQRRAGRIPDRREEGQGPRLQRADRDGRHDETAERCPGGGNPHRAGHRNHAAGPALPDMDVRTAGRAGTCPWKVRSRTPTGIPSSSTA